MEPVPTGERGMAKGTLSLMSHTTSGALSAVGRITKTVGRVSVLMVDDAFLEARERRHAKHTQGPLRPVLDIAAGVSGAVTGLVMDPVRGARADGVGGFFKGAWMGVTGCAVKPLVGVLDAATFGFESVAEKIGTLGEHHLDPVRKRRLPHCFGTDDRLLAYSTHLARGAALIAQFPLPPSAFFAGGDHAGMGDYASGESQGFETGNGKGQGLGQAAGEGGVGNADSALRPRGQAIGAKKGRRGTGSGSGKCEGGGSNSHSAQPSQRQQFQLKAAALRQEKELVILLEEFRKGPGVHALVVVTTHRVRGRLRKDT